MVKTKPKQETGLVKREPESIVKPAQISDYFVGDMKVREEKDKYIAFIQLGKGIKPDSIKVSFDKGSLEFKVSQKQEKEEKDEKKGFYLYQSSDFSYYRKVPLPKGVDSQSITSSLEDGVFNIYIPKKGSYKKLGPAKEK
jgi:HSP20 family molecular chaperone IbpA